MVPKIVHNKDVDAKPRRRRLRYVQTLPTLCTLGNLLCGFGAMTLCLRAMCAMWVSGAAVNLADTISLNSPLMERLLPTHLVMAAYLIFLAAIFDALDGRLARWTRHTTDFGAQLDSLADVVSFGVAPPLIMTALLMRQMNSDYALIIAPFSVHFIGRLTWIAAAVYAACAALRLARFNVENKEVEQSHQTFRGLPTPGAAGMLVSLIILHDHIFLYHREGTHTVAKLISEQGGMLCDLLLWSLPVFAALLGLFMVSRLHYLHFANRYLRGRRTFTDLIKLVFVLVAIAVYPEITLVVLLLLYTFSAPVRFAFQRFTVPSQNVASQTNDAATPPQQHSA